MTTITPTQLRAWLEEAGISQLELARRIGKDGRTVRRWAAGTTVLKGASAEAVMREFGKSERCPKCCGTGYQVDIEPPYIFNRACSRCGGFGDIEEGE